MKPNICAECKHFVLDKPLFSSSSYGKHRCNGVEQQISVITGDPETLWTCEDMRAIGGLCGPRGKLWEPLP